LSQKVDQFARNFAQHPNLGQVAFHSRRIGIFDVIEAHHFILDVKIQLTAEETAQILVDKIIHGVAGRVLIDVLGQHRAFFILLGGRRNCQQTEILGKRFTMRVLFLYHHFELPQDRLHSLGIAFFTPCVFLSGFFRVRTVFKVDDQFAVVTYLDWIMVMDNKKTLVGIRCFDIAMFAFSRVSNAKMDLERRSVFLTGNDANLVLFTQCTKFLGLPQIKGEIGKIFCRLDIILICIGPVQFDLFTVIRNRKWGCLAGGFSRVVTTREKVTSIVIPLEKTIQMIVDIGIAACAVFDSVIFRLGLFNFWGIFRVRHTIFSGGLDFSFNFGL